MENEEFLKIIHNDVVKCIQEVGKAQGFIKMNYSRIVKIDEDVEKCFDTVQDLEKWKAGHEGIAKGKSKMVEIISSKTTLLCTIGALILGAIGFYYAEIKPAAELTAGLAKDVTVISQKFEAVLSQLE